MTSYVPQPYGAMPRGNQPDGAKPLSDRFGRSLKPLFSSLIWRRENQDAVYDEMQLFEFITDLSEYLNVQDICRLSAASGAWYTVLHSLTDVWRKQHLAIRENVQFVQDWKTTTVLLSSKIGFRHNPVSLGSSSRVFSDALFQSWMCTSLPPDHGLIKTGKRSDGAFEYRSRLKKVAVVDDADVTEEVFDTKFEKGNVPLVIRGGCAQWPVFRILNREFQSLRTHAEAIFTKNSGTLPMRCECFTMTPAQYTAYAEQQNDERPTYLFDPQFDQSMPVDSMFTVPRIFSRDDFFGSLGCSRPHYRWLIAGPKRGGSSFHVDPNFTNAWNACLTGRKRWLFFPPNSPPPGVYPSDDMSDVTTPVSLTEWLLNFYDATVDSLRNKGYECVCEAGDIVFVPCGWWHFVINLEDSVALTQNYVSRNNLSKVLTFLKHMKRSISGVGEDEETNTSGMSQARKEGLRELLIEKLKEENCPFLAGALQTEEDAAARRGEKRQRTEISFDNGLENGFMF